MPTVLVNTRVKWLWSATASFLSGIFGLALSLNRLARGCRRIWRGEIWKDGFGGAVADLGLLISGSRRRPRRSQLRGQLRHDRSHQLAEGGYRRICSAQVWTSVTPTRSMS